MQPTEVKVEGGETKVEGGSTGAVALPPIVPIAVSGGAVEDVEGGKKRRRSHSKKRSHKSFRKHCKRGMKRSRKSGRCVKKTSRVLSPGRRHRKSCRKPLVRSSKSGRCVTRRTARMAGGSTEGVDKIVVE
jgi:hypothetical protein